MTTNDSTWRATSFVHRWTLPWQHPQHACCSNSAWSGYWWWIIRATRNVQNAARSGLLCNRPLTCVAIYLYYSQHTWVNRSWSQTWSEMRGISNAAHLGSSRVWAKVWSLGSQSPEAKAIFHFVVKFWANVTFPRAFNAQNVWKYDSGDSLLEIQHHLIITAASPTITKSRHICMYTVYRLSE